MSKPPARPPVSSPHRLHRFVVAPPSAPVSPPVVLPATDERPTPAPRLAASRWYRRILRRPSDPIQVVVILATAVFALAGIGTPLLGLSVFADTGSLARYSGYRDVLAGVQVHTDGLRDQVDAEMPNSILFGEALRNGEFAAWDPYTVGGAPLAGTPNLAIASPLSTPYWVLPGWLAPAYTKLLELICAIGGTYLFLRRLRLGKPAAWLGGLVFASSAFMVVWTGWPQTRVAALIPVLFWALDRLCARVRVREVALVGLVVAGMLLGGFPAVTGYALLTAAGYVLFRVFGEACEPKRWLRGEHVYRWRPVAARLAGAGAGVAAGVALAAWQLVPWLHYMSSVLVDQRSQKPTDNIPGVALLTMIAPEALGTSNPSDQPTWFGPLANIDAQSYVGAGALVLVVAGLALAGTTRRLLPRAVWWFVVGAAAFWGAAIYVGGPLLAHLQRWSYLFSDNPVGRARSVLGFLLAILAAVGFEALLARRSALASAARRWATVRRLGGAAVWATLLGSAVGFYLAGREYLKDHSHADQLTFLSGQFAIGVGLVVLAGACVVWLWFGQRRTDPRWARPAAAVVLVLLVAGQALWWVQDYYPRTDMGNFYPTNPTQTYLADHLGHQRYYGTDGSVYGSVDAMAGLRGYNGHSFIDQGYAELAAAMPGDQFPSAPTTTISSPADDSAGAVVSPVLDRAAVSYYVVPPDVMPFGTVHTGPTDGTIMTLYPGQSFSVELPVTGPVRGVGLVPAMSGDRAAQLEVTVFDGTGAAIATDQRALDGLNSGHPWLVPVAADTVGATDHLTARITVRGDSTVDVTGAGAGLPVISTVSGGPDNLRLVYAQESVIYQRMDALDRARWASSAVVEPSATARVSLLAGSSLQADQVVLNAPGPGTDGLPAQITWVDDGLDQMVLDVQAQGAGYLVLADAIQTGWRVTVDDAPATLLAADHAFAAVAVGPGDHAIRFFYPGPLTGTGAWVSGLTVVTLLVAVSLEAFVEVRSRRRGLARLPRPPRSTQLFRSSGVTRG
jgi:hypothetical protein